MLRLPGQFACSPDYDSGLKVGNKASAHCNPREFLTETETETETKAEAEPLPALAA